MKTADYSALKERVIERGLISAEEMERIIKLQEEQRTQLTRLVVELGLSRRMTSCQSSPITLASPWSL